MNEKELALIREVDRKPEFISSAALDDITPRTLVYGYTLERNTFHVWLTEDGQIGRIIYDYNGNVIEREVKYLWQPEQLSPSKRAYPQHSDFEFGKLMKRVTEYGIPYTTWQPIHPAREETYNHPAPYQGYTDL